MDLPSSQVICTTCSSGIFTCCAPACCNLQLAWFKADVCDVSCRGPRASADSPSGSHVSSPSRGVSFGRHSPAPRSWAERPGSAAAGGQSSPSRDRFARPGSAGLQPCGSDADLLDTPEPGESLPSYVRKALPTTTTLEQRPRWWQGLDMRMWWPSSVSSGARSPGQVSASKRQTPAAGAASLRMRCVCHHGGICEAS